MTPDRSKSIIAPPQRLKISEWADRFAYVADGGEPGKYHLRRMPHQAAMLDDCQEPGVREVFWMGASQAMGKTLCLILLCEYVISVMRKSLIMVRDTKDRALEWMRNKFLPTVDATPEMHGLLVEPKKRGSNSTALSRRFPGGAFTLIGAKSRGAFRGTSAGIVLQDEIDAYEVTKEGDPCALADRATITFTNAWKLKCSTTTLEGFSRILEGFRSGDQQKYFLPCPCCGHFQWLQWEQLKFSFTAEEYERTKQEDYHPNNYTWEIGDFPIISTRDAIYVCESCNKGWTDHQRIASYLSGHPENPAVNGLRAHWRATAKFDGVRSRHFSGMYLTIGLKDGMANYLQQFAEDFLKAKRGGRETLMAWTNMFKNEPFEDSHEKQDWRELRDRAEDYNPENEIPAQVVFITWGGDVHPDRVELLFYGWGDNEECWVLDHVQMYGDFDMPSMQERVWDYLDNKRFRHQILGDMKWSSGALDSGHQTKVKAVYQFCARHRLSNVYAIKGFAEPGGAMYQIKTERLYGGKVINSNADTFKTLIFDRLRNKEQGPRYVHFPKTVRGLYGDSFYQQLCSERKMPVKHKDGSVSSMWVKHTSATRNEVLDMTHYAFVAFEISRQREWIARKWKEVQIELRKLNPPDRPATVEVPIEVKEQKVPELRQAPRQEKLPDLKQQRRPGRRRFVISNSPFSRRF